MISICYRSSGLRVRQTARKSLSHIQTRGTEPMPPEHGVALFESLLSERRLNMCRSPLFDVQALRGGQRIDPDRVRGMLLGLAIGDALGNTSEGMNPAERRR